jgi:predicted MFS family arabinose efflux permease
LRMRYQVLLLAFVRITLHSGSRMIYPFLSAFARGLGVDLAAISLAITVRSAAGLFTPFFSALADRWNHKTGIQLGLAIFVIGNLLVVIWPTYMAFIISLVLASLGSYMVIPTTQAYLGDRVNFHQRGLAIGLNEAGWALGFMLGMPVIAFLIRRFGWLGPFPALVVMGLAMMVLVQRLLPSAETSGSDVAAHPKLKQALRLVFSSPIARIGLVMGFFISAANEVVTLVFGVWIETSFGLMLAALGGAAALIGVSELIGELSSGSILDRLGKKRTLFLGLVFNGLTALALPWMGQELWGALLGLTLFYFGYEFIIVSEITLMTGVLSSARATLMGANLAFISLGRMAGALIAPVLYRSGFQANALAALAFDLLAILALWRFAAARKEN